MFELCDSGCVREGMPDRRHPRDATQILDRDGNWHTQYAHADGPQSPPPPPSLLRALASPKPPEVTNKQCMRVSPVALQKYNAPSEAGPLLGRGPVHLSGNPIVRDANAVFDRLDSNSDGVLSRDEFRVAKSASHAASH